jgi:hypothetical protein
MVTKDKPSCAWCGRKILEWNVYRCRKCDLPVCAPVLKDCGYEHWRDRHIGRRRRIVDVRTEGTV